MKHDPATADKARALRESGMTAREISARLGVPKPTVQTWISGRSTPGRKRERCFNMNAPRWVHSDATVAEARALRKAGLTGRAISNQLGISMNTVHSWFREGNRPVPA